MALKTFIESGVRAFTIATMDSAAFQGDHWIFIHIPKTGGSSLREDIADVKQPNINAEVRYAELDPALLPGQYDDMMRLNLSDYCTTYLNTSRFLSGHFTYRDMAPFEALRDSKLISMVRDPLARLKSDYLHQISQFHPLYQTARQRYPTFRHFIEDPNTHNVMTSYLCQAEGETVEDTIAFILERFAWIGIQEDYRYSIKMLYLLFGMRIEPQRFERVGVGGKKAKLVVSTADLHALHNNNAKDYELYEYFLRQHQARISEAYALFSEDAFFRSFFRTGAI